MPLPPPLLSPKFTEALLYASELHGTQRRKGSGIPFMAHLLGVASIVLEDGGDEEEAIAALLHDAVEDHPRGGATEREILERFGARVHRIVMSCTEPDPHALERGHKGPWEERKQRYIEHLRTETAADAIRVATADKLYNVRSIINDMRLVGEEVWKRFSVPKEKTLWYYRTVTTALEEATPPGKTRLVRELAGVVTAMERGVRQLGQEPVSGRASPAASPRDG
ncbi:MAG TPA: HD domain-containing protein [Gemmatimonadales bacterium]|nr:HD domain-containing protein [Gemmatimonadales bacterium]